MTSSWGSKAVIVAVVALVALACGAAHANGRSVRARGPVGSRQLDDVLKHGIGQMKFPMLYKHSMTVTEGKPNLAAPWSHTIVHPQFNKLSAADRDALKVEVANIRTLFTNVSTQESR